jgi:hypothetical protein
MVGLRRWRPGTLVASLWVQIALGFCAGTVWAGIADSPLPQFADGKQSLRLLDISGIVKRNTLQTDFLCTSIEASPVDIGVEVFDVDGTLLNDVHAGNGALLAVDPGQTVTFGTKATVAYSESQVIALPGVSQGSARIVATSERVRCNVMVLDDSVAPPITINTMLEGTRPVLGGILSIPLPQFSDGQQATHAALFPGIIKRRPMETSVFCTSLASQAIDVGVEILAPDGSVLNSVAGGNGAVLNVSPGATITVSTGGTAAFFETTVISATSAAQGSARIVSTSGQLTCTAVVLDSVLTPPTSMSSLVGGNPFAAHGDVNQDGEVSAADITALIKALFP